ncbi:hypothetical protein CPB83DRAFT_864690 [Crepidotus variabilis]|uniref:Uncharacterized protein n=1 Tax=Crepidotus variabilis TaxID=179855 RepID=A0A9P6JIF7_9AGAR|nr:hypothetical protein CPB83DRAFT_864690 [Crepidotus variabilis]
MAFGYLHLRLLVLAAAIAVAVAANFDDCINRIHQMPNTTVGGTDNRGNPMIITNATAITYDLCVQECGADPEPFAWPVFSQQFSAWLLPWLALISQLPFGANDKMDNLQSMLLSIGSPVLAAYALVLTTLNGRWITKRFFPFKNHPNAYRAVRVLSSLQQAPLRLTDDHSLLVALVTLRANRHWWGELLTWLNLTHSWSISAATSIAWVFIAYIFTVVDSFTGGVTQMVNANGQGVGSIWLWLLAIVVAWLQISPKCDSEHLHRAMNRANKFGGVPNGKRRMATDTEPAMYLSSDLSTLRCDESRSPPIFNYARLFSWVQSVEQVAEAFEPSNALLRGTPSPSEIESHRREDSDATEMNTFLGASLRHRSDSKSESSMAVDVTAHSIHLSSEMVGKRSRWGEGTWRRIVVSGCVALFLQWGTTGAAVVVVWYTPTTGLGCRSAAYLLYGIISTLVWMAMLISSILSHYSVTSKSKRAPSARIAAWFAIALRRLGKFTAACNGIGLVITCLFQFSNFFDRCYCNSSVLYWGSRAYNVISFQPEDVVFMRSAWIGGVFLAAGSTILFFIFINLFINPPFPTHEDDD